MRWTWVFQSVGFLPKRGVPGAAAVEWGSCLCSPLLWVQPQAWGSEVGE